MERLLKTLPRLPKGTNVFLEGELTYREYDRVIEIESGSINVQWPVAEIIPEVIKVLIARGTRTSKGREPPSGSLSSGNSRHRRLSFLIVSGTPERSDISDLSAVRPCGKRLVLDRLTREAPLRNIGFNKLDLGRHYRPKALKVHLAGMSPPDCEIAMHVTAVEIRPSSTPFEFVRETERQNAIL